MTKPSNIAACLAAIVCLFALVSCGGSGGGGGGDAQAANPPPAPPPGPNVLQKGNRLLGLTVNEAQDGDFPGAFFIAQSIGIDVVPLVADWTQIDIGTDNNVVPPAPIYETNAALDVLGFANSCYANTNTQVALTLRPVKTLVADLPAALAGLPFDDPAVIDRFKALLDHVFAKTARLEIATLAIGSEVDLFLTTQARQDAYRVFYTQISDYARTRYAQLFPAKPALRVSVEATLDGLLSPAQQGYLQTLNQASDVLAVSYYPVDTNGVRDPGVVASEVQSLIDAYGQPLYFLQLGYPSGYYDPAVYPEFQAGAVAPTLGSSDLKQAQFIDEVFKAWDRHATRIGLIVFAWENDISQAEANALANDPAFGAGAPALVEFLRTLGLRTSGGLNGATPSGTDKAAFTAMRTQTSQRGWLDTGLPLICN